MKKFIIFTGIFVFLTSFVLFAQEATYVGANKCKICHKSESKGKQFPIWQESKHSKSLEALTSPDAPARAKEMGVENPADNPKCLQCHAPLSEAGFKEEGVSCEVCHGAGSIYKKMSIMKNREEAIKNGLKVYDSKDAIKAHCLGCHENAHGQSFDFDASWEKIKHYKPEK